MEEDITTGQYESTPSYSETPNLSLHASSRDNNVKKLRSNTKDTPPNPATKDSQSKTALDDALKKPNKLEKQLAAAKSELEDQKQQIGQLKQSAKKSKADIETQKNGIQMQLAMIEGLKASLAKMTKAKEDLDIDSKNKIAELQHRIDVLEEEKRKTEVDLNNLKSQTLSMNTKPSHNAEDMNALKRENAASLKMIEFLNDQV